MIKVLFICHGNICRSPMGEFILKRMVAEQGIEELFEIASAATSTEEIWNGKGNPIYPPAKQELYKHGIKGNDVEAKRARQVTKADYDYYDYLVCMDSNNVRNTLRIVGGDPENKIKRLLEYADEMRDVSDPWYSDRFDIAYSDIYKGCVALLEEIMKNC